MITKILWVLFLIIALPIILTGAVVKVFLSTFLFGFYLADVLLPPLEDNRLNEIWRIKK